MFFSALGHSDFQALRFQGLESVGYLVWSLLGVQEFYGAFFLCFPVQGSC